MDTNVQRIVTAERGRLAPLIERVNGRETRDSLWGGFDSVASRFALGRIDATEFRAVARELGRDAAGTAAQQDRDADTGAAWIPDADARAPWATMPPDGSGRMSRAELAVVALVGVAVLLVLVRLGELFGLWGGHGGIPADTRPASRVVLDAEMITQGGYWSWSVADGCARGPAECDAVMREVNTAAERYGVRVWEDGTISPVGRRY